MSPVIRRLSPFAADKGRRLAASVQDALHPIVNDKGLVAVRVSFLYEADGQMLGGSLNLATSPGAGKFLDELERARTAGDLDTAAKETRTVQQMVKS